MPLLYAVKHVFRSWKLFLALLIGITLASTFFAGIDIKANATARQALDQQLSYVHVDMDAMLSNHDPSLISLAEENVSAIEGISGVEIFSTIHGTTSFENASPPEQYVRTIGIQDKSRIYDGWLNKPTAIGENKTYVLSDSQLATYVHVGDSVSLNFSIYDYVTQRLIFISWNLTVEGLAQLDNDAYAIATGQTPYMMDGVYVPAFKEGFFIVDWEKTMVRILEDFRALNAYSDPTSVNLLIYVNRDSLITPWDMDTSGKNIVALQSQVENTLGVLGASAYVQNYLSWALSNFAMRSMIVRYTYTIVSLPIFFMAWYMGTTVSDVSFNLRRREIGLLSTKGFSRGQILRIFLAETFMLGLIGGMLGIVLGFLLIPVFTQFDMSTWLNPQLISPYTITFTMVFGAAIAFLSTYSSARKASRLATVDALREYLPMEDVKSYRKRWPWVAFSLGTYKIVVFAMGINMTYMLTRIAFAGGNFILILLAGIFLMIDGILTYIGPLLFFWGAAKLFIQGSLAFQELTTKVAKFLGDLGALATKNVRRNPARSAAVAFLIALIISYGAQVTTQLASEQDYTVRRIHYEVGSDISINVASPSKALNASSIILQNNSESIENSTIEYSFQASSGGYRYYLDLKAIDPQSWLKSAYYEDGWFSGNDVSTAFSSLAADNDTIILERAIAKPLNLNVGDSIALSSGSSTSTLRVVGFFGPEPSDQSVIMISTSSRYWSFVPEGFFENAYTSVSVSSVRILLKLKGGANGTALAENIRNLNLDVGSVASFDEELKQAQSDVVTAGTLDAQRLGIIFAVLAASAGTALVSAVSMRERSREATIMSVRGLSYKQLVMMFLTENLAVVTFSVLLGVTVGLIVAYGNIASTNAFVSSLIMHRLVLPLDSALLLLFYVGLIFISTVSPILIISRRYVTKLERMVRLR